MGWEATAFQGVLAGTALGGISQWLLATVQAKREKSARFLDERRAVYIALLRVATHAQKLHERHRESVREMVEANRALADTEEEIAAVNQRILAKTRRRVEELTVGDPERERLKDALEAIGSASSAEEWEQAFEFLLSEVRSGAESNGMEEEEEEESISRAPSPPPSFEEELREERRTIVKDIGYAFTLVELVGSAEVEEAAQSLAQAILEGDSNNNAVTRISLARAQFLKAARKDLAAG